MKLNQWRFISIKPLDQTVKILWNLQRQNQLLQKLKMKINIVSFRRYYFIYILVKIEIPKEYRNIWYILVNWKLLALIFQKNSKCDGVHRLGNKNIFSKAVFGLNYYRVRKKWKHKIIPIELSENDSDGVVGLLIFLNFFQVPFKNKIYF